MLTLGSTLLSSSLARRRHRQDSTRSYALRDGTAPSRDGRWRRQRVRHLLCPENLDVVLTDLSSRSSFFFAEAAYLDTEGTFRTDRIKAIANRAGVDGAAACESASFLSSPVPMRSLSAKS